MNEQQIRRKLNKGNWKQQVASLLSRFKIQHPSESRDFFLYGQQDIRKAEGLAAETERNILNMEILENAMSRPKLLKPETRDEIQSILCLEVYPEIQFCVHKFIHDWEYSWFKYQEDGLHEIYKLGQNCGNKISKVKAKIGNKEVLHRVLYTEAERFDQKNAEELAKDCELGYWDSPENRNVLAEAGKLWILANENPKAERYYERAGPWEWAHAAGLFEEAGDLERAIKFWTLAAKKPTGYSDEIDYRSGLYWEKAGNLPEAIKSFRRAIRVYHSQEGTNDLHGDPSPGDESARVLEKRVKVLEKLIAEGKGNKRNPISETTESLFTFPME
jgi:tetratricopeptide (TPR) repeat protein